MIKKILFIASFFVVGTAFSQTFQLLDHNDVIIENTTHMEFDDKTTLSSTKFHVKNLTGSLQSFSVKVEKEYVPYVNSDLGVCFGSSCYSGLASVSGIQTINSGSGDDVAANSIYTDLKIGPSTWMWNDFPNDSAVWRVTVYKTSNVNDSTSATIIWKSDGTVAVREIKPESVEVSAYPNPATDNLTIKYDLNGSANVAILDVYDVLGQQIVSKKLTGSKGLVQLDLEKINSGVYFYAVKVAGEVIRTERFIVK